MLVLRTWHILIDETHVRAWHCACSFFVHGQRAMRFFCARGK